MKLNRLLEITTILLNRKTITASELAERFGVSTRTIYRDIDVLSASGVPVYATQGTNGGIYLEENVLLVCNEEGKCLGLDGNRRVDNGDIIAGTFLIYGGNEEGEMISLTDEQIEKYSERFKEPELYSAEEVEEAIFIEVYGEYEDEMEV